MGGSWGGYFALRALLVAPETYHVAIADCPDVDLYHDGPFGYEAYMGLPKDDPEAYEYGSNLSRADALEGKLLLVAGTRDPMVFTNVMLMVEALVKAQKPYDLIVLPEQGHDYTGDGATYFADAVRRYLVDNLRPYEESELIR
jgi:dipeptidyl aminopeptidase/acylaminoacyl peptidase